MTTPLHPRQREILEFLRGRARNRSYPPTVREIGKAVGLSSSSTVQNHLNTLEGRGYIRRDPTKSRTVELVQPAEPAGTSGAWRIPLVGRVAAGTPVLAAENVEDHLQVGVELAGAEDAFALRVAGDSMIQDGILDGDLVVVRPNQDAAEGSIVVARVENPVTGESEVTVKRLYRESGRVRLQPANDRLEPIYPTQLELEGTVVAVMRLLG
ncbi:MAG TPA: transcriptional repressor LexA [Candidatus Micrarchaeia archaeon]|nr:transcriptional repressor LexA [Candidatus Micrarchaeia archaeon]